MEDNRYRLAYRRPKKGTNWPLWVILGVFAAGILGFLASGGRQSRLTRPAAGPSAVQPGPVECEKLPVGGCYGLSRETPLCAACGAAAAAEEPAGPRSLPAGSQVGIIDARWVDKVRWYHVQAVASDGKTALGTGWVSSTSLEGQYLKPLR